MIKKILYFLLLITGLGLIAAGGFYYYLNQLFQRPLEIANTPHLFKVKKGQSLRKVLNKLSDDGIPIHPDKTLLWLRLDDINTHIKAGAYEIESGESPKDLLYKMTEGLMAHRKVSLIEGKTSQSFFETIQSHEDVEKTLSGYNEKKIIELLDVNHKSLEGLFYPDTYIFVPGDKDIDILKTAYEAGQKHLTETWESRDKTIPVSNPYELLIMASIVEKETGHHEDRDLVAGVFMNRLKVNMPLQTDPSVIYGMKEKYTGKIKKVDLQTDTPWNTYTRKGLPPTPIANPGKAALDATGHPAQHDYYYFVSKGDGTSAFSKNLNEHNNNVRKYILKKN